ncbi:hypothetical protein C8R43DRAFT_1022773 [Mycena crocata]|nr:hypothetical protein C8R43DRAFT_1022773 [Mycena crocata]
MASQSVYSPISNGYPPRPAVQWNPFLGWVSEARPSSSLSQYALIGPYHPPTSSGATSATPSHSYDDLEEAVSRSHADASRMSHQQDHPVFDPSADCIQPVDMNMHSFSSSFGSRSTPSENYDEDAENIDPNSPERKGKKSHRPFSAQFRVTHILRDSQTFPLADAAPEESQQIAAPVPLSYSARSKEVLSAMISPVQPSGLPNPIAAGPQQPSNDRCTYTQTTRSSFAPV